MSYPWMTMTGWISLLLVSSVTGNVLDEIVVHDDDLEIKVVGTSETESYASIICDAKRRLFVGGREAVFVYEHDGYHRAGQHLELYRFGKHEWVLGLAIRGHDLYAATHRGIWLLEDAVIKRQGVTARPIVLGFPKAANWGYHQGLHDLEWGPEGKLYFALGDLGWYFGDFQRADHWVHLTLESPVSSSTQPVTLSGGGILRCNPDGTEIELVATGLRNPNGMVYSPFGDLFTTDNDHEQDARYVPSRLLHVAPGSSMNWPRSWMEDRPDTWPAMAGMGRDVPIGLAWYGDHQLGKEYRDNLILCRWGQHKITCYTLTMAGASYTAEEHPFITTKGDARPVAVTVLPDGRVCAVICWMASNEASPTYRSAIIEVSSNKLGGHHYMPFDPVEGSIEGLAALIQSPGFTARRFAHLELIRRGPKACAQALPYHENMHLSSWESLSSMLELAAYANTEDSRKLIQSYLRHDRGKTRYQAMVATRACVEAIGPELLHKLLRDDKPQVRRAAIELVRHQESLAPYHDELIATAETSDRCLRLAVAWCLAERGDNAPLNALLAHESAAVRLTGVLAVGTRLTIPAWNASLPETLKLSHSTAEDFRPEEEPKVGLFVVSDWHAAMGRTPQREGDLQALQRCAAEDTDTSVRLQALRYLILLKDRSCAADFVELLEDAEPEVRELATRGLLGFEIPVGEAPGWLTRLLSSDLFSIETRLQAIGKCRDVLLLRKLTLNHDLDSALRSAALRRLHALQDAGLVAVIELIEPGAAGEPLIRAVQQLTGGSLDTAAAEEQSRAIASEISGTIWPELLKNARVARGKSLFDRPNVQGVSCRTCHTFKGEGGTYGPSLDDAHARLKPEYVARSILFPSDEIVPEYRTIHISLLGGQSARGVTVGEDGNSVTLAKTDGTTEVIPTSRISWRTPDNASIMPQGMVHSREELIDLVGYIMPP